ncbi:hypothetical protein LJC04_04750 [Ruminococcaceae bacterium OttesenSCG-928-O06]|nr:hypothetical protein [Ruminococcaceae bacterium OttesenSCG-928-O06]
MAGRFFLLQNVTDFAPGFFDNTVMEDGGIQLVREGGHFPELGSYTSPAWPCEAFFSLLPSWNADTPAGTSVEMQVRVSADGRWSRWFGFGRWSPYIDVASPAPAEDAIARVEGGSLTLADGCPAADMCQMRVLLFSEDLRLTPTVRLLALSTNAAQQMDRQASAYDRVLDIPAYSCQTRDPSIAGRIAGATSLTMMLNRWGRDLLPEEVARAAYDGQSGSYANLSFLCAAGGMYGFACHVAYAGLAALRREVWQGRAVAARVHYRAPSLPGQQPDEIDDRPQPPVLEGATVGSSGHLVVVCGFARREGTEYVVMHNPQASADAAVRSEIPLAAFAKIYTGLALFMAKGTRTAGRARPARSIASLTAENGVLNMRWGEVELLPACFGAPGYSPATVCYTLSEGIAYASGAQRKFYYPFPDEDGNLTIDAAAAAGRRITLYFFTTHGRGWVAEKLLPALPAKEPDAAPAQDAPATQDAAAPQVPAEEETQP